MTDDHGCDHGCVNGFKSYRGCLNVHHCVNDHVNDCACCQCVVGLPLIL